MKTILVCLFAMVVNNVYAQGVQGFVHKQSEASGYVYPTDGEVLKKLDHWQDQKFGVLFHWGLYSLPGIVESWSICSEDVDWITRKENLPYNEYKQWYWGLKDKLNPVNFNPQQWADVMADAGAKYMIFTTKHHDGFCTFDSKFTDFSIANGPFATNPRKDLARYVFDAFREKNFMIGCYFSKPDWHCPWFWNPEFATPNRHINYNKQRHPDWWANYQQFTRNQLNELMTDYGHFDILWLDGGWISGDDIGLDEILVNARKRHPGLISVDRAIRGKNENYQTPERGIPATQLSYPWESCITLSNDWGWVPNAPFKSAQKVINMLIEITAKGGCLALGIGPTADGIIQPEVVERMHAVGQWLRKNGEAIYCTRNAKTYNCGNVWFTANKDGQTLYAIYALPEGEALPNIITWKGNVPAGKVTLLGSNKTLKTNVQGDSVVVYLPKKVQQEAVALKFVVKERQPLYKQASAPIEERVADLLQRMTIDEKVGQLCCPLGWEMYEKRADGTITVSEKYKAMMQKMPIGAFWAVLRADPWTQKTLETGLTPSQAAMATNAMQRYAVQQTRLGIPLLLAEEAAHGHMAIGTTVFPTSLAQGSTWNPALLQRMGEAIGQEVRLQGGQIGYGPVLDLAREPRWSRTEECLGEDPVLAGTLGAAVVRGMQGENIADGKHVYSTLKHFAAYGSPEGGHNAGRTTAGMRQVLGEYLPQFKKAVEAGAGTIMASYNQIDGVPCSANEYLLTQVLRDKWGFSGFVFSDLQSIEGIRGMGAAKDNKEGAALALKAGLDVDLGAGAFGPNLKKAYEEGLVTIADIDRAVGNVLRLKFKMGLFENPYVEPAQAKHGVHNEQHKELALQVAREGIVLLKNDGVLPLTNKKLRRIAVVGPNANAQYNQLGDYTAPQYDKDVITPLEGISDIATSRGIEVVYAKGCAVRDTASSDIAQAVATAQQADVIVVVVGGSSARDFASNHSSIDSGVIDKVDVADIDCGEGNDRSSLQLLGNQQQLLEAMIATGKPVVAVYMQGRTHLMNYASQNAAALLTCWYPGEQGGKALAEVLFGDYNPSGKLPVSVPRSVGQLPVYYSLGEAKPYCDGDATPLYSFGYGLSYTHFEYCDMATQVVGDMQGKSTMTADKDRVLMRVSCTVKNVGKVDGAEVVQLYVSDKAASVAQPPILLKAFKKIDLKAGESQRVEFDLTAEDLSIIAKNYEQVVEAGEFEVMIGAASSDIRLKVTAELR